MLWFWRRWVRELREHGNEHRLGHWRRCSQQPHTPECFFKKTKWKELKGRSRSRVEQLSCCAPKGFIQLWFCTCGTTELCLCAANMNTFLPDNLTFQEMYFFYEPLYTAGRSSAQRWWLGLLFLLNVSCEQIIRVRSNDTLTFFTLWQWQLQSWRDLKGFKLLSRTEARIMGRCVIPPLTWILSVNIKVFHEHLTSHTMSQKRMNQPFALLFHTIHMLLTAVFIWAALKSDHFCLHHS